MTKMYEELIISGFGGQGIVLAGSLLAQAAIVEDREVSGLPSYSAEVRGGASAYSLIISTEEITAPLATELTTLIAMNLSSLVRYESLIRADGLLFVNSSLIYDKPVRQDLEVINIAATQIANTLGDTRVANMVILGAYVTKTKIVTLNSLFRALEYFKKDTAFNKKALEEGAKLLERN
ncbi:MAG: 2-oxoacid:acceptor oxidoreductase family protein [bacterium]|nr:2-oxoacid:acceptor oxidoreductase family protein [bacterium]